MLSHHNLLWTAGQLTTGFGIDTSHRSVCYLPLSHVAEQVISVFAPMLVGGCIAFAESLETLVDNLREIRPTFFFGVPRVWEKIQARMEAVGAQSGFVKRRLARWARRVGRASGYAAQRGERPVRGFSLADKLVFQKVKRRLGFDRVGFFATSAAPIAIDTLEFFLSLNMPLLEVYGMTECSGPGTLSRPDRYRTGAAGFTLPGTELKLAEDGEIWMRGPHVFRGYFKNPEATSDALDADGWLHSGDIGVMDDDGFLKVVDRKKELIITSGGKNIAPVPIELQLKSIPSVAQAVVVGDGRKYLTALLTLDPDRVPSIAESVGSSAKTPRQAVDCRLFRKFLEDHVSRINEGLASYEGVKRFAILPDQLSVEEKTLTPTLKLRRRNIAEFYRREIEELYEEV
jgi:long-subunit acyl-CoA synthetase (AMP-forming)